MNKYYNGVETAKLFFYSQVVGMEIVLKNRNFGQKSKFWSKIETLVKNRIFNQTSKFWSKI